MLARLNLAEKLIRNFSSAFFGSKMQQKALAQNIVEQTFEDSQVLGVCGHLYLSGIQTMLAHRRGQKLPWHNQLFSHLQSLLQAIEGIAVGLKHTTIIPETSLETLTVAFIDWSRVQIQLDALFARHHTTLELYKKFYGPWIQFGNVIGFQLNSHHKCAYTRCYNDNLVPYASLLVCRLCQGAYYCSHACQRA